MSIKAEIERFVLDKLDGWNTIDPDASLFEIGLLDSLAFLQLLCFIEEQYGLTIEDGEVITDNFETLNRIEDFVGKKMQNH